MGANRAVANLRRSAILAGSGPLVPGVKVIHRRRSSVRRTGDDLRRTTAWRLWC